MKGYVIDTSALIRLYVPDGPLPEELEAAVEAAWRSDAALIVPELALAEAAQVLRKKEKAGFLQPAETEEILSSLLLLPLEIVGHRDLLEDALAVARNDDLTVYDALFLVLARSKGADLVTADAVLATAFDRLTESR